MKTCIQQQNFMEKENGQSTTFRSGFTPADRFLEAAWELAKRVAENHARSTVVTQCNESDECGPVITS
jgi:hypothetical protein